MDLNQATDLAAAAIRERVAADGRSKFTRHDYEHLARMTEALLGMPDAEPHKLCPDCAGRGTWPRTVQACTRCGGDGKV